MPDPFRDEVPTTGALARAANPFRPGAGKVPPRFGSRFQPLLVAKTMVDRLAVPADPVDMPVLRGVRGVGKTALMAYTRSHAARTGAICLHVEADAADRDLSATCATLALDAKPLLDDMPARIARRLSVIDIKGRVELHPPAQADGRTNLEALLHDLVLLAEDRRVGLLLTVDEVHEAEDLLLRPLMRAAHRHAQDGRAFGVMLSGLPGATDALMAEGQTYTERLRAFDLGMLDREGVREALADPFAEDADLDVDEDVIAAVHADSGGYPFFVQLWGAHLWNVLPEARTVTAADARLARPHVEADQHDFYARRWRRIPKGRGRDLVRALAGRGGEAAIGQLVTDVGVGSASDLSHYRHQLIRLGMVFPPSYGRLAFTVPGFAEWVVART